MHTSLKMASQVSHWLLPFISYEPELSHRTALSSNAGLILCVYVIHSSTGFSLLGKERGMVV